MQCFHGCTLLPLVSGSQRCTRVKPCLVSLVELAVLGQTCFCAGLQPLPLPPHFAILCVCVGGGGGVCVCVYVPLPGLAQPFGTAIAFSCHVSVRMTRVGPVDTPPAVCFAVRCA